MFKCLLRYRMVDKEIKGISDLVKLSGVARNTILKLYREQELSTIRMGTLTKLCDALDCSLSDLIEYTPDEK